MHFWVMDVSLAIVNHELGTSKRTIVDWLNFFREICSQYVAQQNTPIGGPGKTVEIDESVFCKTKYNRGRRREHKWVFGGVERGNPKKCFFVCVEDRTRETLIPIIKQYIAPGSTIVSDEWRAYRSIGRLAGFNYTHLTVNHSENFVNPQNPEAHTQSIESLWGRLKKPFKRRNGTSDILFRSYVDQFIFRSHFAYPATFGRLLFWIQNFYPV